MCPLSIITPNVNVMQHSPGRARVMSLQYQLNNLQNRRCIVWFIHSQVILPEVGKIHVLVVGTNESYTPPVKSSLATPLYELSTPNLY